MHPVLALFWIIAGVTFLAGAIITVVGLHRAPEAFEDADGFHYVDPPARLGSGNAAITATPRIPAA
jgi:hypothetical protein